ncbi:hypothetical protein CJI48_01895 [Bifidobacteriaceae bacterium GH005]|nr:hypothetical protein CJI48_01895 [Bifidobacteriaceae bacterium GH005]
MRFFALSADARAGNALTTKLALEVHWTSNLSEFPLRVAFARYALNAQASRRAKRRISTSIVGVIQYRVAFVLNGEDEHHSILYLII